LAIEADELSAASALISLRREHLSVAQVNLGMQGAGMMRLDPHHIIVDAERVEDCQVSIEGPFREMIEHALSRGWSIDETLIALNGLISKEFAEPDRAVTLH
jgi:hypothetical protein